MQGWRKYLENELNTGSSGQITILAYEKCIAELKTAKEKIEKYKYKESEENLNKIEMIILELMLQLNHDALPELAEKIENLYIWIVEEIRKQKIKRNAKDIDPIVTVIQNLLDGFKGAMNK